MLLKFIIYRKNQRFEANISLILGSFARCLGCATHVAKDSVVGRSAYAQVGSTVFRLLAHHWLQWTNAWHQLLILISNAISKTFSKWHQLLRWHRVERFSQLQVRSSKHDV